MKHEDWATPKRRRANLGASSLDATSTGRTSREGMFCHCAILRAVYYMQYAVNEFSVSMASTYPTTSKMFKTSNPSSSSIFCVLCSALFLERRTFAGLTLLVGW